jgi:hypothetical protein
MEPDSLVSQTPWCFFRRYLKLMSISVFFYIIMNTNCLWNLLLDSVDNKFKLLDFASTRQKELTIERKQLCESQSDRKTQISDVLKNIDIRWFVGNFKVEHIITMMENLHGEILPTSSMYEKLVLNCCASDKV